MRRRVRRLLWIGFAVLGLVVLFSLPIIWGDLVYPLKYADMIRTSAAEFNVPPALIAGVIYTESHFNADARSGVGARGLMQIMPATGAGIARNLGVSGFTTDQLNDPATNIRFGAYYLHNLADSYNGDLDVMLSGYNGGPGVAGRYQIDRNASIPLETSAYIIKVKRARDAYLQLYGPDLSGGADNIGDKLRQQQPKTLWDLVFGRIFGA